MDMIEVSTIDYLPGYRITKSLGIVFSSKIMNQAIASDNTNIEEMLDTARQEAMAETVAQASRRHASAIINVRSARTWGWTPLSSPIWGCWPWPGKWPPRWSGTSPPRRAL